MSTAMSSLIRRSPLNPVLTPAMAPYESSLVFNAGVAKYQGRYVMVFRNDYGSTVADWKRAEDEGRRYPGFQTKIGLAFSHDGLRWEVQKKACFELKSAEIIRAYDPRITVIDGRCYMCFAVDTRHGVCGGIAVTDDFDKFEVLGMTIPDNRNMVLFPEKIGGKFVRLERPFPEYSRAYNERFDIWMSRSPDCRYWGDTELLLGSESVPYSNCKIGPGAPPVKTRKGWLTTIHAVYKHKDRGFDTWHAKQPWTKEYFGGLMLLDLDNPARILGLCQEPLLRPEADYELRGFRGNVIFPGGMILEDSGEVKIYYGAADSVVAVATADVGELINLCKPFTQASAPA